MGPPQIGNFSFIFQLPGQCPGRQFSRIPGPTLPGTSPVLLQRKITVSFPVLPTWRFAPVLLFRFFWGEPRNFGKLPADGVPAGSTGVFSVAFLLIQSLQPIHCTPRHGTLNPQTFICHSARKQQAWPISVGRLNPIPRVSQDPRISPDLATDKSAPGTHGPGLSRRRTARCLATRELRAVGVGEFF